VSVKLKSEAGEEFVEAFRRDHGFDFICIVRI
jgi:hypothetical protein